MKEGFLGHWVSWAQMEIQVSLDPKVKKVPLACLVFLACQAYLATLERVG